MGDMARLSGHRYTFSSQVIRQFVAGFVLCPIAASIPNTLRRDRAAAA